MKKFEEQLGPQGEDREGIRGGKTGAHGSKKIVDLSFLRTLRQRLPYAKLIHCHGVFDLLHAGHLSYFSAARQLGDVLVVTITADEFVNKGPGRPYFNAAVRANMLAALEIVDFVCISQTPTAVTVIEALQPHFYVKGPDYREKAKDVTGGIWEEEAAVEHGGGRLVFTDDPTFSSSHLLNEFFSTLSEDQQRTIELVRKAGGQAVFEDLLEQMTQEEVVVVGEPIVDTYVFCRPEAISSKSPTVSARFSKEENYLGGSLAIANHLADFVGKVSVVLSHGDEPYFKELLERDLNPKIQFDGEVYPDIPTPRKTRYLSDDSFQRMFELTNLRSDQWMVHDASRFCQSVRKHFSKDRSFIVADFGHGLFEGPMLQTLSEFDGFMGLNVQTNSSNWGYNPFSKHRRFSYLSIDTREARVAFHDRYSEPLSLVRRIWQEHHKKNVSVAMTLGPNGAHFFSPNPSGEYHSPAFAPKVLDATGAGDAFFAITSMLVKLRAPEVMIPFLGNVFAGLKTKIIGNKSSVSKAQFIKTVTGILK